MFARSSNPIFGQIAPDPTVPGVTPEMMMAAQQTPPPNMGAAAQMPNPLLPPQQRGQFVNVPAPHSGGMFGGGKVSIDLSRAIAGFLAGMGNPAGFQSLKSLDEQRQEQMALEQQRQQRQQDLQDQMSLIDYRYNHEPPATDEYTRALLASGIQPGSPEWEQHMANRAAILENPPRYEMVNGALVQVGGPSIQQSAPAAPVGNLKPYNPGGPTPPASDGFPQ